MSGTRCKACSGQIGVSVRNAIEKWETSTSLTLIFSPAPKKGKEVNRRRGALQGEGVKRGEGVEARGMEFIGESREENDKADLPQTGIRIRLGRGKNI